MKPDFAVQAGSEDVTALVRRNLSELRVTTTIDRKSDSVEIVLADDAGELVPPNRGRVLKVSMGYESTGLVEMGSFTHSSTVIDLAPRVVRIKGTAADFRASAKIKAPHTRSWDQTTLGQVVLDIAARHGLTPAVDQALASKAIAHIDQTAESDLHLLRRLAEHYDASAKVAEAHIVFARAGVGVGTGGAPLPTIKIKRGPSFVRGRVEHNDRSRYASVRADWHDAASATLAHVVAGSGEPMYAMREPFPTREEAQAATEAQLAKLTRRSAKLSATLVGDPTIAAGDKATTVGWGEDIDAEWIVTRTTHSISSQGYTTDISAELPS